MKKYAPHILMLMVLIGLLTPIIYTGAQQAIPTVPVGPLGPTLPGTPVPSAIPPNMNYQLLAPLPGLTDFNTASEDNTALGTYLNTMIQIFIGICAVLAVVMIVLGGLEYMTSELISSKEEGRKRITNAVFGLILALGAYTLLFTINPNLLNTDFQIPGATVQVIQEFQIAGALSRSPNVSTKINFNKEAYPAALAASQRTGVPVELILAIFAQETSNGANTGGCLANDPKAKMKDVDKAALRTIVGGSIDNINVSCAGSAGYGGAVGLMQFLPSTWLEKRDNATRDPWNVNDALMVGAIFLKDKGGATNPRQAACAYFGQCSSGGVNYADQILGKMLSLKQQIATAKSKGEIN